MQEGEMQMDMNRNLGIRTASVMSVIMFVSVCLMSPAAYAYSSDLEASGSIDTTYTYVNVYTYKGTGSPTSVQYTESGFTEDKSLAFDGSSVKFTKSGSNYTISGTASLSGHYVAVLGNTSGLNLSATVTQSEGNVSNISYTLKVGGTTLATDGSGSISVTAGYAYSIDLSANLNNTGYSSETAPVLPTVTLSFSVKADGDASTVEVQKISIKYSSVDEQSDIIDANKDKNITTKDGDDNPSYTDSNGTHYLVPNESRTDGNVSVYITEGDKTTNFTAKNSTGTDSQSTTLNIPSGKYFVVQVTVTSKYISGSTINITLKIGTDTYNGSISSTGDHYFYVSGTTLDNTTNINNVTWMKGDEVSLSVSGSSTTFLYGSSSISVQIVMKG